MRRQYLSHVVVTQQRVSRVHFSGFKALDKEIKTTSRDNKTPGMSCNRKTNFNVYNFQKCKMAAMKNECS